MKTIFNIPLLKSIKENHYQLIGQENYFVLRAFLNGFEMAQEPIVSEVQISQMIAMPDIREHVSNVLEPELTPSLNWEWALGFYVESETELFHKYIEFVLDYDEKYKIEPPIDQFNCKYPSLNITQNIQYYCKQPNLFGYSSLSEVRAHIDGALHLAEQYNLPLTEMDIRLKKFVDYWKNKVNAAQKFETWERVIMKDQMNISPFTFSDSTNNGWVLNRFIEMLKDDGINIP